MTESIDEQILDDIEETLAGVAPPEYRNSLTVQRYSQTGNVPADGLVVMGTDGAQVQEDSPLGHDDYILPVLLLAYAIESEDSSTSPQYRLASLAADIHKALEQDLYRGGIALNTTFDKDESHPTASPPCVLVKANIRYRTLFKNPYGQ